MHFYAENYLVNPAEGLNCLALVTKFNLHEIFFIRISADLLHNFFMQTHAFRPLHKR
jgi:hypothetical protein